jgi:prevent-host-death family protein
VAEAKAKLSELLSGAASDGPQCISRNGEPIAMVVSIKEWDRLAPRRSLIDVLLDSSHQVLTREEVDSLFARDNDSERPAPDLA